MQIENMRVSKYSFSLLCIGFVLILASCNKAVKIDNLFSYLNNEDNGFVKEHTLKNINYKVILSSPQIEAIKRNSAKELTNTIVDSIIGELSGQIYFYLKMKDINGKSLLENNADDNSVYDYRLHYLIGEIKNDFSVLYGKDTIPCALHHYEKGYDVNPEITISLLFDKPEIIDDKFVFIYEDRLFGGGTLKFNYSTELLNKKIEIIY